MAALARLAFVPVDTRSGCYGNITLPCGKIKANLMFVFIIFLLGAGLRDIPIAHHAVSFVVTFRTFVFIF